MSFAIRAAVIVALAVAINVLVAWTCAVKPKTWSDAGNVSWWGFHRWDKWWPDLRPTEEGTMESATFTLCDRDEIEQFDGGSSSSFGILYSTYRITWKHDGIESEGGIATLRAGWPYQCLNWACCISNGKPKWTGALPLVPRSRLKVVPDALALPLCPMWRGFAANTAFYSVAVTIGAVVIRRIYRAWRAFYALCRRLHGRCGYCGYDMGDVDADACPECGGPTR
jgi:hypothetical protein